MTVNGYIEQHYYELLRKVAGLVHHNNEQATDLLHHVLEGLLRRSQEYHNDLIARGQVTAYVMRGCWNRMITEARRTQALDIADLPELIDQYTTYSIDEELCEAGVHLADMTAIDRKIISLHLLQGYTVKEISTGSGVSEKFIRHSIDRAKAQVKKIVTRK